MNLNDLKTLIKTGEGYTIEFKESINSTLGKEICAFANADGGKIILGVTDNGDIKGFTLTNKDKSQIQDIARNMNPSFKVNIEQVDKLAIIYIPIGKNKPYTVNGHFYIRQGANSQQLNRDEIKDFFQNENHISFEKQTTEFNNVDFSNEALKTFKQEASLNLDKEQILKNLNLTTNNTLNNAGILYFSKNIKRYHPNSVITCVLYQDNEQVEILDKKEFDKDFKSNLEEAYKYTISKLNNAIIITGKIKHDTKLELPKEALREAIINAMIHKDYLFPAHIQINITKEKVEIINPGKLLFPKSEFGKTSAYRNPILADLLLRTGDIEKIGSGIKRIKKLCKEENIKVSFETNEIFRTTFYRNQAKTTQKSDVNPTQIRRKSRTISSEIELKSLLKELNIEWSEEWSEKWSEKWSELTKRRKQILILIINNPNITRTQLSEKLKINPSAIQKHIDLLKEKKIIIREGPDKGGSWRITK